MGRVCQNCGRGYEHETDGPFGCGICGARNHADGSIEYDGSREDVDRMKERIRDYDERD